jgi:hypothetical protein
MGNCQGAICGNGGRNLTQPRNLMGSVPPHIGGQAPAPARRAPAVRLAASRETVQQQAPQGHQRRPQPETRPPARTRAAGARGSRACTAARSSAAAAVPSRRSAGSPRAAARWTARHSRASGAETVGAAWGDRCGRGSMRCRRWRAGLGSALPRTVVRECEGPMVGQGHGGAGSVERAASPLPAQPGRPEAPLGAGRRRRLSPRSWPLWQGRVPC